MGDYLPAVIMSAVGRAAVGTAIVGMAAVSAAAVSMACYFGGGSRVVVRVIRRYIGLTNGT